MKRTLPLLAAILVLAAVCGCNGSTGSNTDGTGSADGTGNEAQGEYVYPELDFKGETITVSTMEARGATHEYFTVDAENTDDTLDAAIYESNMRIQEKFNFTLHEDRFPRGNWDTMWIEQGDYLIRNFMSGDDVFDFIFYAVNQRPDLLTSGYLLDLSDYEELQLDQPWWDTKLNEDIAINDRLYMTTGSINLQAFDNMACLIFNKEILLANHVDSPYDMVRDGTWTLDALYTLASECKNLNTDPDWAIPSGQGGTSIFGVGMHRDYPPYFLTSAGIPFVTEANGNYDFSLGSDDFYLALDTIQKLFTHCHKGGVGGGDASNSEYGRLNFFLEHRVAFCMISTIEAFDMRESEIDFGFLPLPKLREEQEEYITSVEDHISFLCIPAASDKPEEVTAMLDALAYDRYKNVVPVYYDSYVTYKGVRDEDSLEMLEIMTAGRTMDIGIAYGWCYELVTQKIGWNITSGTISSTIASDEGVINDEIDAFVNEFFS